MEINIIIVEKIEDAPKNKYSLKGTNSEIASSFCNSVLRMEENDSISYIDLNGVICNRIGRMIRTNIIPKEDVNIILFEKGEPKIKFKFDENGKIKDFIFGFFDVNDDDDVLLNIKNKFKK